MKIRITETETEEGMSKTLREMGPKARSNGSFEESMRSAAFYARKHGLTYYVYRGNSYGVRVFHVSYRERDYLCPVGNDGSVIYSVDPDLNVSRHLTERD